MPGTSPAVTDPTHSTDTRCGAKTRAGGRCVNRPVRGATRCRMHGGALPQVKRAAARRLAVEDARREVTRLGLALDVDPLDVLLDLVRESAGNVAAYRLVVEGLGIHVGPDGVATEGASGQGYYVPEDAHILVRLYNDERDRLAKYARMCIDAGVSERKVRVAEQQAGTLARLFGETLDELAQHVEPAVVQDAKRIMARKLRALSGGESVHADS